MRKALVDKEHPGLVIEQAIDEDCNQTDQVLAALSDLPKTTFAIGAEVADSMAQGTREADGGLQTFEIAW